VNKKALLLLILFSMGCAPAAAAESESRPGNSRGYETDILVDTFGMGQSDIDAPMDQVFQGCPERDCIPSIDQAEFIAISEVDFLADDDLVLSVSHQGETRAYATRILDVHEIVNDQFGDIPVVVTYCPLCGSGLAFVREIDGEAVEFGVSGLLHNNDLIMYDRKSESLWQQITGRAIAGPSRGQVLENVPVTLSPWASWRKEHPDAQVLALPGEPSRYAELHYADYESGDGTPFPVSAISARLKPKQIVYGIESRGLSLAIKSEWLAQVGDWSIEVAEGKIRIEMTQDGGVVGTLDGAPYPVHRMYWFAWYSFHPSTMLVGEDAD
jgi:hypothetical protein